MTDKAVPVEVVSFVSIDAARFYEFCKGRGLKLQTHVRVCGV